MHILLATILHAPALITYTVLAPLLQVSRLFRRMLQRLDGCRRRQPCLSKLLDGWPATKAASLGQITLAEIAPCVRAPEEEGDDEDGPQAPQRWRDNRRPWSAGGRPAKAFKREKHWNRPKEQFSYRAPAPRGRAAVHSFTDGTGRIGGKPKRGRPNHRSSRSR